MDPTLFPENCLKLFTELETRRVRYMIVGMGAVSLHGGVIVTDDVDLWIDSLANPDFHAAVRAAGGVYIPPGEQMRPPTITGSGLEGIDLVSHMSGLSTFDEEYRHVQWIPIGGFKAPVLSLGRIIACKRAANRPKDRVVLPILEDLERTLETIRREGKPR